MTPLSENGLTFWGPGYQPYLWIFFLILDLFELTVFWKPLFIIIKIVVRGSWYVVHQSHKALYAK